MANSYLARTPSSAGNRKTWTYSAWFKIGNVSTGAKRLFTSYDGSTATNQSTISLGGGVNHAMQIYNAPSGSSSINLTTNRLFRDCNAWYHIVVAVDTTQSTGSNRVKLYINGVQETSFSTETYGSQNEDFFINSTNLHTIGRRQDNSQYFDGYMAHVSLVDGQQLAPTVFGQTDSTSGIWKFKSPSGVTWGTNGFHLKMENSAALGTDSSGNSNTFTVNGNLKQALDTPSNVYATLNPLNVPTSNAPTFSNANSKGTSHSSGKWVGSSTLGVSSGKWYMEVKVTEQSGSNSYIGVADEDGTNGNARNNQNGDGNGILYKTNGQYRRSTNSSTADVSYGNSYAQGDIIGIALNCDDNEIVFYKNGTAQNSGTAISIPTPVGFLFLNIALGSAAAESFEVNFGNGYFGTTAITSAGSNGNGSLFEYDVPSGYYALNTKNINTYG
jgi:hypothetical protein